MCRISARIFLASLLAFVFAAATYPQAVRLPISLSVDAREAPRGILHARLVIPAAPGPLTLLYPKWIPGEHGPTGPITNLVGLKFFAAGKPIAWRRDDVDMYAFRVDVPAGTPALEVELDYVAPTEITTRSGRGPMATANLMVLNWNQVLLYPQGPASDELTYGASLTLPAGWKVMVALATARQSGDTVEFAPVSLTTLVDSPALVGQHSRVYELPAAGAPPHELDLAADSEAALDLSAPLRQALNHLVAEARALFGAHPYRRYRFLLALSDNIRPSGLEHHESSDNRTPERFLLKDTTRKVFASLLPHEFVHTWNAKYRRPAGLTTRDYHEPMKGELLWVYEGLTQYLGEVLTARSGLYAAEEFRENLAQVAAYLDHRPGRTWRPLADTAIAAQTLYGAPPQWSSWRRGVDFYDESILLWLEADVLIRQQTQGRRSLDDFCRLFHGGQNGAPAVKPYTFDDLVTALNQVAAHDWRGFFNERLNSTAPRAPLAGLEASGWRLVYNETPNDLIRASEEEDDLLDLTYSLGLKVKNKPRAAEHGEIIDVIPGSPAAQAGLAPGMKLLAVNRRRWSATVLRDALRPTGLQTAAQRPPIELLAENGEVIKVYPVSYSAGERYPHLEGDPARPDLLSEIIKPRTQ